MAFDRHMNLVLGDAEEYRKLPPKKGKSEDEVCPHLSFPSQVLLSTNGVLTRTLLPVRQIKSDTALPTLSAANTECERSLRRC